MGVWTWVHQKIISLGSRCSNHYDMTPFIISKSGDWTLSLWCNKGIWFRVYFSLFFWGHTIGLSVVYFDQRLGAAHSKRWLKKSFSVFFMQKSLKRKKFSTNFCKKTGFCNFAPKRWSTVLFPKNELFLLKTSFYI